VSPSFFSKVSELAHAAHRASRQDKAAKLNGGKQMANELGAGWSGWRIARWSAAAILLATPAVMMQISDGWHWGAGAFVAFGIILGGIVSLYELSARKFASTAYGIGVTVALITSFLVILMNIVGSITGREEDPVNLSFFGLVLAAATGAFAARLRPDGMARAMLGTAGVQAFLGMMIATAPSTLQTPRGVVGVLLVSGFFMALWLISAACFWKAAHGATADVGA
jgi:hypothetical protein